MSTSKDLGLIVLEGKDTLTLLNAVLSQQMVGLGNVFARQWLWLEAKGQIVAEGTVLILEADNQENQKAVIIVDQDLVSLVEERLKRFRFSLKTDISVDTPWHVAIRRGAKEIPDQFPVVIHNETGEYEIHMPQGYVQILSKNPIEIPVEQAFDDWEDWRISAGIPVFGVDILENTRAQELGLLQTHVHLQKGCYPGQESIAKIYNIGEARRALALIETSHPLTVGMELEGVKRASVITSANDTHALAFIPRKDGKSPSEVTIDGAQHKVVRTIGQGYEAPGGWREKDPIKKPLRKLM